MSLYSYKGAEPAKLQNSVYVEGGLIRTNLYSLDAEQLEELGFTGPYALPGLSEFQYSTWDSESFSYIIFDLPSDYVWYREKVVYDPQTKTIDIVPIPEQEVQERFALKFKELKAKRKELFTQADFAVSLTAEFLCDICEPEVLQYEELIKYKNELRDLFENTDDPFQVKFPIPPGKLDRVLKGQYGAIFTD